MGHHLYNSLLPHYNSLVSIRKELVHLFGAPIFVTAYQRAPSDYLVRAACGAYMLVVPQDCIYEHSLKAAAHQYNFQ